MKPVFDGHFFGRPTLIYSHCSCTYFRKCLILHVCFTPLYDWPPDFNGQFSIEFSVAVNDRLYTYFFHHNRDNMQELLENLQEKLQAFLKSQGEVEGIQVQLQQLQHIAKYLEDALTNPAHDVHTLRIRWVTTHSQIPERYTHQPCT